MTLLYSVATGGVINAADVNQYKSMLEGASGYTSTFLLTSTSGTNFIVKLGDAAGVNKLVVQDSAGVEQWAVSSDGVITGGLGALGTLVLPAATVPSQTAEGQVIWDSDNDQLTIGTGSGRVTIGAIDIGSGWFNFG